MSSTYSPNRHIGIFPLENIVFIIFLLLKNLHILIPYKLHISNLLFTYPLYLLRSLAQKQSENHAAGTSLLVNTPKHLIISEYNYLDVEFIALEDKKHPLDLDITT